MLVTKVYLFKLLFLSVFNSTTLSSQDTIIIGKAINAKFGAIVVTPDDMGYYLDKLKSWSPEFYEKKVKVTGKLVTVHIKKQDNSTGTIKATIKGPYVYIIKRYKVELVSD